ADREARPWPHALNRTDRRIASIINTHIGEHNGSTAAPSAVTCVTRNHFGRRCAKVTTPVVFAPLRLGRARRHASSTFVALAVVASDSARTKRNSAACKSFSRKKTRAALGRRMMKRLVDHATTKF